MLRYDAAWLLVHWHINTLNCDFSIPFTTNKTKVILETKHGEYRTRVSCCYTGV